MKHFAVGFVIVAVLTVALAAEAATMSAKLQFVNHLQAKFAEQDVYIERVAGSDQVYRVTANDAKNGGAPLFVAAQPLRHDPFDPEAVGPYPKGRPLGITLGQWLAATGSGTYSCSNKRGRLSTSFKKLVPNGVYTMWYFFIPIPPTQPFTGTLDLPMGAQDGSQNTFKADAKGNATYKLSFKPCLQLSGDWISSGLAIAYHSDGKTYGSDAGAFGTVSHVQLFLLLPKGK